MFQTSPLSIIRSFSLYTQQWYMSYRFADTLLAGSGRKILLASCQQTCMTHTIAVCTVKNSWWWTKELSETCRVLFQKQTWEISASNWFFISIYHAVRLSERQMRFLFRQRDFLKAVYMKYKLTDCPLTSSTLLVFGKIISYNIYLIITSPWRQSSLQQWAHYKTISCHYSKKGYVVPTPLFLLVEETDWAKVLTAKPKINPRRRHANLSKFASAKWKDGRRRD